MATVVTVDSSSSEGEGEGEGEIADPIEEESLSGFGESSSRKKTRRRRRSSSKSDEAAAEEEEDDDGRSMGNFARLFRLDHDAQIQQQQQQKQRSRSRAKRRRTAAADDGGCGGDLVGELLAGASAKQQQQMRPLDEAFARLAAGRGEREREIFEQLRAMGFEEDRAAEAVRVSGSLAQALDVLLPAADADVPSASASRSEDDPIEQKKASPPPPPPPQQQESPTRPQQLLAKPGFGRPMQQSPEKQQAEIDEAARSLRTKANEPLVLSAQGELPVVAVDQSIACKLMDFQRDGVRFLWKLYAENSGGILADDMGLGKTVQTIAFVSAVLGPSARTGTLFRFFPRKDDAAATAPTPVATPPDKQQRAPQVLLVVPAGVIEQWVREFEKWLSLTVDVFHGADRAATLKRAQKGHVRVMISSYDTFRIDIEQIGALPWSCIFFDEVHKIKNRDSLSSKCCKSLATPRRFGLTGTLMQNNFEELHTLIDFVCPNYLGSLDEFRERYVNPIKTGQRHGATLQDVARGRSRAKKLALRLQAIILRRDKSVISKMLPGKDDNIIFCKLTPLQVRCYERLLGSPVYKALSCMCSKCRCKSGLSVAECPCPFGRNTITGPLPNWKQEALPAIVRLQKAANHLLLLSPDADDDPEKQQRDAEFLDAAFGPDRAEIVGICEAHGDQSPLCGKLAVLKAILEKMRNKGRKVLLFSHMTRTLNLLEEFLRQEQYPLERMDGSVPPMQRQRLVDRFSLNPSRLVFLLSLRTTSLGFNIPAASAVVIFDPDWNPSQDLQAQDRAYRIGQTRHTSVYRLIAAGTVEEVMYNRQIYKNQLSAIAIDGVATRRYFEGVAGMKGQEGELWGMANLFRFNPSDSTMTDQILQRAAKAEEQMAKLTASGADDDKTILADLLNPSFSQQDDSRDDDEEEDEDDLAASKAPAQSQSQSLDFGASGFVVYSVRHADVVHESRVEREISEKTVPVLERHEADAKRSPFFAQQYQSQRHGQHHMAGGGSGGLVLSAVRSHSRTSPPPPAPAAPIDSKDLPAPSQVVDNVVLLAASMGATLQLPPRPTLRQVQDALRQISSTDVAR